jgi:putative salt-induced outer membrane protein YdiY
MKKLLLIALAALAALPLLADEIHLKNGDIVRGTVVKKEGGKLTVKTELLGTVTLDWDQVTDIRSTAPLHVVLPGGQRADGPIATQGGRLVIGQTGAPMADISAIRDDASQAAYERYLKPGIFDLWTVSGSINFAGTKGNASTSTFTTPISFARASNTSTTTAYFNSIKSSATINGAKAKTAQAIRGGWAYSRNIKGKFFANAFNDWEYDRFQSLDLRVVLGGGLGYHAWKSERGFLDLVAGIAWNREKFDPSPAAAFTRSSAEFFWGNNLGYKLNSRTNLTQSYRMFNNLSNTGAYRQNFDIGASTQLTSWLTWNIGLSDRYLSNPVPGRKKNDFLYTTGLGFTFAR